MSSDCDEIVANASRLNQVVSWFKAARECKEMGISEVVESLLNANVVPENSEDQFFNAFCSWLVPRIIDADESLRSFQANAHDSKIQNFKILDKRLSEGTSNYVRAVAKELQRTSSGQDAKEFSSLSRELQKRQGTNHPCFVY